jgi:radical SAM protein with 4Fe4S-binding SPASM domain
MAFFPKLNNKLFYANKNEKHLFLNPSLPDWIVVNENGAVVLTLCDGTRSDGDVERAAAKLGGLTRNEVSTFLARAAEHGIMEHEQVTHVASPNCDNDELPLRTVHFKLTNRCNFQCLYCYAESGKSLVNPLPFAEIKRVVDEALDLSSSVVFELSGGEPMLHPDFFAIAEYISTRTKNSILLTNGSLVSNKNAKRIVTSFQLIKISLDGSTDEINAVTRGKRTFKKVKRAIKLLRHEGANVMVSMTVNKANIDDIPKMVSEFGNILTFAPMFQAGRGKGNDLYITGEEYYHALANVTGVNPLSSLNETLAHGRRKRVTRCAMASSEISIADDGSVYPCQLLHEPEFCAGNVRSQSLQEIYGSERFRELRQVNIFSIAECRECPIRYLCAGACRARSYFECGSIHVSGGFCAYEKLAYVNGLLDAAAI